MNQTLGDDNKDREHKTETEKKLHRIVPTSLLKRQIHLTAIMKLCIQYRNTYHPLTCLPPVFQFNMLRAHLEVNPCKNLEQKLEYYGFQRNANGQLIPIITD